MSEADTKIEDSGDVPAQDSKVRILLARAADFLHEDRVGEARMDLAKALRLQPNNEQAKNLLGLCLFRLGDLNGAKKLFSELIGKNESEASLYLNLAMVQLKAEDFADARATLEVALELQPGHRRAAGFLGLTLERLGLFHDAGVWYDKAEQHERAAEMRKKAAAKVSAAATRRTLGASSALLEPPGVTPAQFSDVTPSIEPDLASSTAEGSSPERGDILEDASAYEADETGEYPADAGEEHKDNRNEEEVPEPPPLTAGDAGEHAFADDTVRLNPTPEMPQVFDFDLSAEMERFSDSLLDEVVDEDATARMPPAPPPSVEDHLAPPMPMVPEAEQGHPEDEAQPAEMSSPDVQPPPWQQPSAGTDDAGEAIVPAEETTQIVDAPPPALTDLPSPTELDASPPPAEEELESSLGHAPEENLIQNAENDSAGGDVPSAPSAPQSETGTDDVLSSVKEESSTLPHTTSDTTDASLQNEAHAPASNPERPPEADALAGVDTRALPPSAPAQAEAIEPPASPPESRRVFESLQDLVTERLQSLLPEDDPRIEGELFRFPVRGKAFVRSDLVVSLSGDLKSDVVYRLYQGERTDGFFGGETQGMWEIQGLGLAYLDVSQIELTQLYLTKESLYLLESALVAFGVGFRYENGRLPDEDGEDLDLVQIEGSGFVALGTQTPLFALQVKERQPVHVRADRLVGFTGDLLPSRLSTSAPLQPVPHSSLQFEGNGFVLTR